MGFVTAAAIGAGGAILGGYLGSQGSSSTMSSKPWKVQAPYLERGFGYAEDAYKNAVDAGYYEGPRVANLDPYTQAGLNMTGNFALGQGANASNTMMGIGMDGLNTGTEYANNARNLLANYQNGDPSKYALGMANTFSSNPYVDQMITASTRDISRNLYENQLPSLMYNAAGSGNLNSTRTGTGSIAEGLLRRGAEDRMADISANIRSGLFNQGLNSGLNQYNTNFTNSLAGNNQLLNSANWAGNMVSNGMQGMYNAGDAAAKVGQVYQQQAQNQINADMGAFNEQKMGGLDLVKQYMGAIGNPVNGSSTTTSGGGATGALGGAAAGLGLYNNFAQAFGSNPFSGGPRVVMNSNGTKTEYGIPMS